MTKRECNPAVDLRVALSMLTLVPGGMGGSETYARALTQEFTERPGLAAEAILTHGVAGFSRGIPERIIFGIPSGPSRAERLRTLVAANVSARTIRSHLSDFEVVHYPFTVPAPAPSRRQAGVQSLLDIQHLELPELFGQAERAYRKRFYEGYAKKADAVVTISHFAKAGMVEILGIDPERIFVAHLGVDPTRFIAHRGARENFVLYPARGWAHKNHARLIEAVGIARLENPELRLVLTGGALDSLGAVPDYVDRLGLVSETDLHDLYRRAGALIFPSLYEGFGLPPLEAMASGCPVAASNAGSLPEVVGEAAVLFDPYDPEAIAAAIPEVLRRADELSARGLERAAQFSWRLCADQHLAAYQFAKESKL